MPTSKDNNTLRRIPYGLGSDVDTRDRGCNEGKMARIERAIKNLKDDRNDHEYIVNLHSGDIRELMGLFQALALRISRIEEHLGITEPVVVPLD